ncbi:hypothetical protein Cgig2_000392 [Carnegiea gigantea]|uniref:Uncharacterized protein n=1 Tax=Carnegiea gigantea TaxID=171969 RepID=A0A9Q1K7L5_9CARY|nr:hypothetical protein Cgig2_000392 [Carnegiea gigantea]
MWLEKFPSAETLFLASDLSDHYPALVKFFEANKYGPKPFKFFDMWSTDASFLHVVANVQYAKAQEQLLRLQVEIQTRPYEIYLYKAEERAIADYKLWKHRAQSFMIQKTKEDWLNLGKPPPMAWEDTCKQKNKGGLGLKNCSLWNTVAVAKHLWYILEDKRCLRVKWIHELYVKGESIWDCAKSTNTAWY